MPLPLGTTGQPDFDQPIELMMDCHRRIEHFLRVLERVVAQHRDQPLDNEAAEALDTALNYFASAAPRHTADEEQSLFPRMRRTGDPRVTCAMAHIDRLESDHREAEQAHARLDELGRRWLRDGALDAAAFTELRHLLKALSVAYREHIPLEDDSVFILAAEVLDADALRAVGEEMKQRRAADPGRPGSRCAQRRRDRLAEEQ